MMVDTIIGLPVETQNGTHLGKIVGVDIDPKMHTVIHYHISSSTFVKKIITDTKDILIHPSQVLSLSPKKMVVIDMHITEPVNALDLEEGKRSTLPLRRPQPMNTNTSS